MCPCLDGPMHPVTKLPTLLPRGDRYQVGKGRGCSAGHRPLHCHHHDSSKVQLPLPGPLIPEPRARSAWWETEACLQSLHGPRQHLVLAAAEQRSHQFLGEEESRPVPGSLTAARLQRVLCYLRCVHCGEHCSAVSSQDVGRSLSESETERSRGGRGRTTASGGSLTEGHFNRN